MGRAMDIEVKPISSRDAERIVKAIHYSGKTTQNSQLHLGVFLDGKCGGAMQFGPPIDRRKVLGLVEGTLWNEMMELNRMAFADWLPKFSESRALSLAFKLIKKNYPHIKWILTFADATQCGDGTIYRASNFILTGIKKNKQIMKLPDGTIIARKTLDDHRGSDGRYGSSIAKEAGAEFLDGHQIQYIYFLDRKQIKNLTVPQLPYSKLDEMGARMYRGEKITKETT